MNNVQILCSCPIYEYLYLILCRKHCIIYALTINFCGKYGEKQHIVGIFIIIFTLTLYFNFIRKLNGLSFNGHISPLQKVILSDIDRTITKMLRKVYHWSNYLVSYKFQPLGVKS